MHLCLHVRHPHMQICVMCFLWKCLHVDVGEDNIMQDVDSVDLIKLSDAVSELKQRDVVHSHPERVMCAEDLHLKGAPESKGEGSLQVPLLYTPALPHFVVTDHYLFAPLAEPRVNVKSNVIASQKVDGEHFSIWFDMAQNRHHHFVVDSSGQVEVVRHT